MLSNTWTDIRYALRTLARNPGFGSAAILPIALGLGINTGIFAILNSVAWRPLPVPEPDALLSVHQDFRGGPRRTVYGARALFSLPEYRAYRDEARTLTGLTAYSREWTVTLGRERPQEIQGILVTCDYFDVLRLSATIGAGLTPANCGAADAPPVVVLSHALWQKAFGGDPQVLQTPIVLNGRDVTVAGVAPAGFDGVDMAKASFFAPVSMAAVLRPDANLVENAHVSWLTLIARRRSEVDIAQVRADLSLISNRIDRDQPGRATSLIVEPAAALSLPVQRAMVLRGAGVVMIGFGLVLLIAAANVANIMLARASARGGEIAIRLSIGATRGRVIRQLLTESAIVALAGAVCGLLLFWWVFQSLVPWLLASLPDGELARIDATPDRAVLAFAIALTVVTTLAFGLVPAVQASTGAYSAMKQDAAGYGRRGGWIRAMLIGSQVALCTMLLVPTALLSRALYAAHTFDPGFAQRNVAVVSIDLRDPRYQKGTNAALFHEQWLERVSALPGVDSIALTSRVPLSPGRSQTTFRLDEESEPHVADVNHVSPNFFSVLAIPIVRGRAFTDAEADAVVMTESTARRYWPGQDAVGRSITMDGRRRYVVGIARDARVSQAEDATTRYLYLPVTRSTLRNVRVLARTQLDFEAFVAAVRTETARMDSTLVVNVHPLSNNLGLLQTLSTITAGVAGALSVLALGLAAVGVYGVVAFVVSRRRREVGLRMALGAGAEDVRRLIMRQTLRPVAAGMIVGLVLAAVVVRLLQSALFGISPYDPIAFTVAPLLMLAVACAAALVPTRRALQGNPMSVLRSE